MTEKLKSFLADDAIFMALLLILVAVTSFGLGRQSVSLAPESSQPAGIMFNNDASLPKSEPVQDQNTFENNATSATQVVASKSGTKYHLLTCPGASQIKETNKIYFDTIALAKAAGYTPAANCKGI